MEKVLVAKLDDGMNSCMRVLSLLKNRRYAVKEFRMVDESLILNISEDIYKDVHLFLSKVADIKIQ